MTIVLAAFAAAPATAQQSAAPAASADKWGAYIDLDGKLGTGRRKLGEADLFVPLTQDDRTLVFGDLRGKFDNHQSHEGNFGLGVRRMLADGWNVGGYGFYDRRHTHYDNGFNQVTIGTEALGTDFDVRANGYIPFGERVKNVDGLNTATLSGTTVIFRGGEEHALYGLDAEVGWRVPIWTADAPQALRLYAGGYRFDDSTVDAVQGPRLRAELTLYEVPHLWDGARVTAGVEWQHDDARGNQTFGGLRLRIPLQAVLGGEAPRLTAQERRMTDPVVRDVDIVSQAGDFGAPETATQLAGGTTFTVLNSATTSGAALPGAVTAAGASSTVLLSGTFNTTALVQVQNGQSLMAGSITVVSPSGRTATLNTPATVAGTDAVANTIQLAGNNTLSGLTITGTDTGGGVRGVLLNSTAGNINILNNTIVVRQAGANGAVGISTDRNDNIVVRGNSITVSGSGAATTMTALGLSGTGAQTATVMGNTLSAFGGTTNRAVSTSGYTINAGSTGNVKAAGACSNGGGNTGSISFTDGTTCP